ncbi:MAG: formylglycine-generating enzyme family protein, partial [Candidatus Fermentibacteria bacterium]
MRTTEQMFSISILLTVSLLLIPAQVMAVPGPLPGMEYVELPGGICSFGRIEDRFGNVLSEGDSTHVNSFQIMTTEVTQGQWELLMGNESLNDILADAGVSQIGPEYPMCGVSFIDCLDFVDSLNALDSLYDYRIPPDKYWEYAFRAGTGTPYFWGVDTLETMSLYCWYSLNSGDSLARTGTRAPNTWGLYDMCGSVFEWCTYGTGIEVEDSVSGRIIRYQPLRGGSYLSTADNCRIDKWVPADSSSRYMNCGLRVARRLTGDDTEATGDVTFGQIVESLQQEDRFAVFVEPVLAVGGIQHTFHEDDIEQF